jgi:hypothetical protein
MFQLETADRHTLKKRIRELEVKISEESLMRSEIEVKLQDARNDVEEKDVEVLLHPSTYNLAYSVQSVYIVVIINPALSYRTSLVCIDSFNGDHAESRPENKNSTAPRSQISNSRTGEPIQRECERHHRIS